MIDGVGKTGPGRMIEASRGPVEGAAATAKSGDALARSRPDTVGGALGELVASGPPVDSAKVAAIRAAIAEGRYPVDPDKIAERMIALDLGIEG
jgi:negative regulator of flagellin synthesis FlgM